MEDISTLLGTFGIRSKIVRQSKKRSVYDVKIQDRKSVELFAKHVGFTIIRRADRLRQTLASYKRWIRLPGEAHKMEPEMRRLRGLGLTYKEIAEKLNLGAMTVWNHLNPRT